MRETSQSTLRSLQLGILVVGHPLFGAQLADNEPKHPLLYSARQFLARYRLSAFALVFLLTGFTATQVVGSYTAHAESLSRSSLVTPTGGPTQAKLNVSLPISQLPATQQAISSQKITVMVGDQTTTISSATIVSWLQVNQDKTNGLAYIHINQAAITASFAQIVKDHTKAAVDAVTAVHDGVTSQIVAGTNGTAPADPASIVAELTKTVLLSQGGSFNLPITSLPFQAVTPAAFSKLIEVNLVTKQMYLYDNGNLSYTYPISAGAPATPTPIGEFHIYQKLPVQDMSGYNANGTKYFQPHVHWINYFLPGGYAVHGNYWRPLSWFGNINSSHGCVSLPDDQAEQVYDWAPLGTTVITHD